MDINYYKNYEPINGRWYLNKEIGRGAFGVVFEAERRDMIKATQAIKIVSVPASQNDVASYKQDNYGLDDKSVTSYFYSFVEEFLKEIQIMSMLSGNKNIVNIEDYDVFERKGEIGWDIVMRMELLTPINKHFANNPVTEKEVIKLGCDICDALESCRKENVIHRDIKPSNIFISVNGVYKLGDFGVARTLEKTSSGLSKKGTYTYMAPEVYKGEAYNSSIDIYSLGIVMYKLLNNNFEPFKTGNSFNDEEKALISRMRGEKIVEGPANASKELSDIILKACSYAPEDRFKTPLQMKNALKKLIDTDTAFEEGNDDDGSKVVTDNVTDAVIINKIMNWIFLQIQSNSGIDISSDNLAVMRIKDSVEKSLEEFKNGNKVKVELPFLAANAKGSVHFNTTFSITDVPIYMHSSQNHKHKDDIQGRYHYSRESFNDYGSRREDVSDQDKDETIGVFTSRKPKQQETPIDTNVEVKSKSEAKQNQNMNEMNIDKDVEIAYRYVVEMTKLNEGIDINLDPSIKAIVCDRINKELDDLKEGCIFFLREYINSDVCGNFKIKVDLSLVNAKSYFIHPVGTIDEITKKSKIQTCENNINAQYAKGQKVEAAISCIMLLTYAPKRDDIWRTLGKIYRELDFANIAVECYEKALSINPDDPITCSSAAVAYTALNQNNKAKELLVNSLEKFNKKDYNYAIALANYALVENKLGNKKQAKVLLRSAKKAGYKNCKAIEAMMK